MAHGSIAAAAYLVMAVNYGCILFVRLAALLLTFVIIASSFFEQAMTSQLHKSDFLNLKLKKVFNFASFLSLLALIIHYTIYILLKNNLKYNAMFHFSLHIIKK